MGVTVSYGVDKGAVGYYVDPIFEQRDLKKGAAVAYLGHKEIVTVSGRDRLSWLTSLSSQKVLEVSAGQSTELLFLTLQGRIEHWAHAVDDGERMWLITEPGAGGELALFLKSMRFALRVEVRDVSLDYAVFGTAAPVSDLEIFQGPEADSEAVTRLKNALSEAGEQYRLWEDPWPGISSGGFSYSEIDAERHPGVLYRWYEYVVPRQSLAGDGKPDIVPGLEEKGALAGVDAVEALRIEAWRPRFKAENDDRTIPHELDLMRTAVHLSKGCYKGQETIARVHNLGHPPRRLVFLHLDGSMHRLPAVGSPVLQQGKVVGSVTSRAFHYDMGPIALAVVKRTTDPERGLIVRDVYEDWQGNGTTEDYAAAQEVIVAVNAGAIAGKIKGKFLRKPSA